MRLAVGPLRRCLRQPSSSASSASPQSPMIGTSTRTFLLIEDGSISIWIFFELRREGVEPAGDAVVEARADRDHHVAIVHRDVGLVGAVHADHAEELLVGRRERAQPHQGQGAGRVGQLHELGKAGAGLGPGIDHAAAAVEQRPLRLGDQLQRFLDALGIGRWSAAGSSCAAMSLGRGIGAGREQHVLGQVDHDRAGPAACARRRTPRASCAPARRRPSRGNCAWCRAG